MKNTRLVGARFGQDGNFLSAPHQAQAIDANCFCVFLQAQQHTRPPYPSAAQLLEFKNLRSTYGYAENAVIAHASYDINLCERNPYFCRKYQSKLLNEARICNIAGIQVLNIHLGSRIGRVSKLDALNAAVERINELHQTFPTLELVLENSAGFAGQLGANLEDIAYVLGRVENPHKTGFALNTSHAFSAGYDFRSKPQYKVFIQNIETLIGFQHFKHMFFNDSQTVFNRRLDTHENLGKGKMGFDLFCYFLQDSRLISVPIILETPDITCWKAEIDWIRTVSL